MVGWRISIPASPHGYGSPSPLLAEKLASSQSTQGHLIINLSKTLLGKLNCWVCVCVCVHTWMLSGLSGCFVFPVYFSGPLFLPIGGDTYKVIMTNSESLWAARSLAPWMCVEMFVSCRRLCTPKVTDLDLWLDGVSVTMEKFSVRVWWRFYALPSVESIL